MDEALKQLHDLHLPAAPGMWPPAPGWWLLAALLAALLVIAAHRMRAARRRSAPLRHAMRSLDELLADVQARRISSGVFTADLNALLKRALIHGAHRHDAAPLTGAAWLGYLDRIVNRELFTLGPGAALGDARFGPLAAVDAAGLHDAAMMVLRKLRRGASRRAP